MTHNPDDPHDPADDGAPGREEGAGRKLDEDAAWRAIVENYGDRPEVSSDPEPAAEEPPPAGESSDERLRGLFRPAWDEPHQTEATWDDEGHFVPPNPPPMRVLDPRRRLAWIGLFGSPFVMLVAVVLGWSLPDWVMFGLATGFAGGFVYLVATMSNRRPGGGPGDDGAVV